LALVYPDLKAQFDGFQLNVVCIETDDLEMIEEMFSRLNEAVPLTAPEKRNAYGGPLPRVIKKLAGEPFFKNRVPFPNKRYRHLDLATKFLLAEHEAKVVDTKKAYLDKFVEDFKDVPKTTNPPFLKTAHENVARMYEVFARKDVLLRQVGMVMLYYHLFRFARNHSWPVGKISRRKLLEFDRDRKVNRENAEAGKGTPDFELLEFDRYAQSPNDSAAITFRLRVLLKRVFKESVSADDL
jgi:hypothetical protein